MKHQMSMRAFWAAIIGCLCAFAGFGFGIGLTGFLAWSGEHGWVLGTRGPNRLIPDGFILAVAVPAVMAIGGFVLMVFSMPWIMPYKVSEDPRARRASWFLLLAPVLFAGGVAAGRFVYSRAEWPRIEPQQSMLQPSAPSPPVYTPPMTHPGGTISPLAEPAALG